MRRVALSPPPPMSPEGEKRGGGVKREGEADQTGKTDLKALNNETAHNEDKQTHNKQTNKQTNKRNQQKPTSNDEGLHPVVISMIKCRPQSNSGTINIATACWLILDWVASQILPFKLLSFSSLPPPSIERTEKRKKERKKERKKKEEEAEEEEEEEAEEEEEEEDEEEFLLCPSFPGPLCSTIMNLVRLSVHTAIKGSGASTIFRLQMRL